MKKLPIGIQELSEIINNGYLYIDKTEHVYRMLQGKYYFLSRPRRFGKSLLVSTLKEIFSGNQALFKGLWIHDKIEWKKYPIIQIDFSKSGHKEIGLQDAISNTLEENAKKNNVELTCNGNGPKFNELIEKLSQNEQVVILVDEYDKPIIDFIEDIPKADANREILRNLFSVLKGNDAKIKFCFLTGVSKFSKVSVFSELNNLEDITVHNKFANLVGYTQAELDFYFREHLIELKESLNNVYLNVEEEIKRWYNGYSWNGVDFVYNPFSILNLFSSQAFRNFWFATGTPTFLIKMIRNQYFNIIELNKIHINPTILEAYEITNITIVPLLFQTGYLTIKNHDITTDFYTLSYPNREVEASFNQYLLVEFSEKKGELTNSILYSLYNSLNSNDIPLFIKTLQSLYAGISYHLIDDKEKYYHSLFYVTMRLLGFMIDCEIETNIGRIDAVVRTKSHIYIIEFKISEAKVAIDQINQNQYAQKYITENKPIILIGIGFDAELKNIGSFEIIE